MFVLSHQLHKLPVFTRDSLRPLAHLDTPLIYPPELAIIAFWCEPIHKFKPVILSQDIKHLNGQAVIVESDGDLVDPADIVRLQPILTSHFRLISLPVVSESGTRLGRVEEYVINLDNLLVQKLHVKQSPVKNLLLNRLVIDRSQVVDISPKRLVVRDASIKETLLAPRPATPE